MTTLTTTLCVEAGPWPDIIVTAAEGWAIAALEALPPETRPPGPKTVSLVLADNAIVQALNLQYRGQDKPTNVLSFAFDDGPEQPLPPGEPRPLGDIILAWETLVREALETHRSLAHHCCHLIVHGALHLTGYDHMTDADAAEMEGLETEILAGLGVPDPYKDQTTPR